MRGARGRAPERTLTILTVVSTASAVAQSVLLARFLVAGTRAFERVARSVPEPSSPGSALHPKGPTVSPVPPQDPHSPPTGPITRPHIP